ncbi:hypothetical protein EBZ80_24970, partial [bacterium]|nr:hypothetical protein [bacterium]
DPVRNFSVTYTYQYYKPMPSYWVVAPGMTVPSPPTVDAVYPEQTVSPLTVVFRVTVVIDHGTADSMDVLALLNKISRNSLNEPTKAKNRPVFGQITRDHCNATGDMSSPLCRINCAQYGLLGMSGQACCGYGYDSCQTGWIGYCSDNNRFAGSDCIAFYQNSYNAGSQAIDFQVKKFIQDKCTRASWSSQTGSR